MSPHLLESELFGHDKGAFTGALHAHHGLFERADRGTLFLDEVAELSLELQAKLLRVLEERTFFRVGGQTPIEVDVRIGSATHQSLRAAMAARRFREDLMYRLRVVPIFLPPLRDRQVDIPILVEHFIARLSARGHRTVQRVAPDAMQALCDYPWPGNVRELKNAVEYALAVGQGPALLLDHVPPEVRGIDVRVPALAPPTGATLAPPTGPSPATADQPGEPVAASEVEPAVASASEVPGRDVDGMDERARIAAALMTSGGHIGRAAELLGVSRPTLWRKRRKLGI
jgi:DNA-binding NtrC family response regulator